MQKNKQTNISKELAKRLWTQEMNGAVSVLNTMQELGCDVSEPIANLMASIKLQTEGVCFVFEVECSYEDFREDPLVIYRKIGDELVEELAFDESDSLGTQIEDVIEYCKTHQIKILYTWGIIERFSGIYKRNEQFDGEKIGKDHFTHHNLDRQWGSHYEDDLVDEWIEVIDLGDLR